VSTAQEARAEATKKRIIAAASELFAHRGYDLVTMREIAKHAGCSHTTIYIYFADKEALLYELAMPHLLQLQTKLHHIMELDTTPLHRLKTICREKIEFCLVNRTMFTIFFGANSSRVDEESPELEINQLRISLFNLLKQAIQNYLLIEQQDERLLAFSRICYYTLHGIVGTYTYSSESAEQLMERLTPTFDLTFESLLIGFRYQLDQGGNN